MDFEFTDDQHALRQAARSMLDDRCPPATVRAVYDGGAPPPDLWAEMCSLDWPALSLPETVGGLDLGFVETAIVVEELGRSLAPVPYLATVTQLVPFIREAGSDALLTDITTGAVTGTAAIAEAGRWAPDAWQTTARRAGEGWVLSGTKSHVLDGATADELVVVAATDAGPGVFLVSGTVATARTYPVLDPTWPLAEIVLDGVAVPDDRVLVEPGDPDAETVIERALQEATTAVALSTVATSRRIVEVTVEYTQQREQFGRPIGSFQALKHRLADCYLSVERASALAYFAALTIAEDDPRRALAVAMAKAAAGDCQRLVVRDGLQLHGGVGFTWEHDLHFWLKRATTGELLFDGSAAHRARCATLLGLEVA